MASGAQASGDTGLRPQALVDEGEYPVSDAIRARVLQDFAAEDCAGGAVGTLALRKGEIVFILEKHRDSGWVGGHRDGDDVTGWFPAAFVEELDSDEDSGQSPGSPGSKPRTSPTAATRSSRSPVAQRGSVSKQELLSVASPSRSMSRGPGPCCNPELHQLQHELNSEKRRCKALECAVAAGKAEIQKREVEIAKRDTEIRKMKEEHAKEVRELEFVREELVRQAQKQKADREQIMANHAMELAKKDDQIRKLRYEVEGRGKSLRGGGPADVRGGSAGPRFSTSGQAPAQESRPYPAAAGSSPSAHDASSAGRLIDQALSQGRKGQKDGASDGKERASRGQGTWLEYLGSNLGMHRGDTALDPLAAEMPSPKEESAGGNSQMEGSTSLSICSSAPEENPRRNLFVDTPTSMRNSTKPPTVVASAMGHSSPAASSAAVRRAPSWQGRGPAPLNTAPAAIAREHSGTRPWNSANLPTAPSSFGTSPSSTAASMRETASMREGSANGSTNASSIGVSKLVSEFERRDRVTPGSRSVDPAQRSADQSQRNLDPSPNRHASQTSQQQQQQTQHQPPQTMPGAYNSPSMRSSSGGPAIGGGSAFSSSLSAARRPEASGGQAPRFGPPPESKSSSQPPHDTPRSSTRRVPAAMQTAPALRTPSEDGTGYPGGMSPLHRNPQARLAAVGSPARTSPARPVQSVQDRIRLFGGAGQ